MENMEKKYDPKKAEKEMQEFWDQHEIYKFVPDGRPIYSIDTPPPTVSGSLHIGHIFSYTQAEIIARYRRLKGFNVFYPFGFDDNGLPTERLVEKELGLKAKDMTRTDFATKCLGITEKYKNEFMNLWKQMGFSCDWNLDYKTIDPMVQKISQKAFIDLAKKGHAYIKESPVLWCVECQTSIAQAELDSKEGESQFNYIPFAFEGGEPIIIATTRPELLNSVVAVFVNPEDDRYKDYIGKKVRIPLYDFEAPVIASEKAAIDKGTGAVMCATFGDVTDVEWATEFNLPYKKTLLENGMIADDVPFIGGMYVKKARKEIIKLLDEKGFLLKTEPLNHVVSVHERCGTDVEIITSKQWYIDVLSKKEELLKAGDKINWYPPHMKNRFIDWTENLKWDWSISRQRYFGIPFPVWYCKDCGKPHFADEKDLPVNPLETPYHGTCECGCTEFIPESSVLDTWATSSLTPLINRENAKRHGVDEKDFMPMSMRTQAHEIIRTWAFYTIARSLYHTGDIPWTDSMICGFVLAKRGEKISKSKSNAKMTPQALIDNNSADIIRYWAAGAKLGTDTFFNEQEMQDASRRTITKIWNSSKFVLSHLADFKPDKECASPSGYNPIKDPTLLPIDRWIIQRTNQTFKEASKWLDQYEIGLARKLVDKLFWDDLCDNYIEIVKDRLYKPEVHGEEERRSAQKAIYYALLSILKMYAIYIPHETEYIFQKGLRQFEEALDQRAISIHRTTWTAEKTIDENMDEKLLAFGEQIKTAVFDMRKLKSDQNLSVKAEMEELEVKGSKEFEDWFKKTESDLKACSHAKDIKYSLE